MSRQEVWGQRSCWAALVTAVHCCAGCPARGTRTQSLAGYGGDQQCVSSGFYNHVQDLL